MIFLSVDGGATKTIAVAYDDSASIKGIGVSGSSNFRNVGVENASRSVKEAIEGALSRAGQTWEGIGYYTFAVAGVKDSARSTEIIEEFISSYGLEGRYSLLNDAEAGYKCRFQDQDGIIAAPGTGMIAYARKGNQFERSSGWGWFIGDEGGAFYIGRRAIQEASRIADGRSERSRDLLDAVMGEFGVDEPRKLVNEVYGERMNIRKIASLSSTVSRLADEGDSVSTSLLEEAAAEAARCVNALQKRFSGSGLLPVSGYGGVFRAGEIYWKKFTETVMDSFADVKFKKPLLGYHAVLGSMYTALENNGKILSSVEVDQLAAILDSEVMKLPHELREKYLMMK